MINAVGVSSQVGKVDGWIVAGVAVQNGVYRTVCDEEGGEE